MCGRYALKTSTPELARMLGVDISSVPDAGAELESSYNVAPSQPVVSCYVDKMGDRRLARMRWGLIPSWSKDGSSKFSMINARAETITEKPSYRTPFRFRRCLVPADGFYEWRKVASGKQPYFIRMRTTRPFAFAGIWERWKPAHGSAVISCSVITTIANETLHPIHPRMPVILSPESFDAWMDPKQTDAATLLPLLEPYPAEAMEAYPVSSFVNKPANNDERCWQALADG
jgi:putative SOS response-associated peptidase YedK